MSKQPPLVRLEAKVTPEVEHALNVLVLVTRRSKASLVREALAAYLAQHDALPPQHSAEIEPTLTRGPGLASQRKERR